MGAIIQSRVGPECVHPRRVKRDLGTRWRQSRSFRFFQRADVDECRARDTSHSASSDPPRIRSSLLFTERFQRVESRIFLPFLSLSLFLQMQRLKSALNLSNDLTGSKLQEQRSSLTKDFIALDKFRYVTSIRIGG